MLTPTTPQTMDRTNHDRQERQPIIAVIVAQPLKK